ncbi:winged helix-turn-helix domain-containing protein [Sphingomonas aliaeris]|uniref:Winged helix-turn-helix domain-containing protein n=1 Tax=Sphingomonas aliaeris TaxID=2759526 RepID=A0A974NW79_9SPHN|nr:winged helix-turn-helix domain-containing protein [Sphingomonas aliaeris]
MTQAQLGDATGLASVHVCRTLRTFAAEGLIIYRKRQLRIFDVTGLAAIGSFSRAYLHLPLENIRPAFSS